LKIKEQETCLTLQEHDDDDDDDDDYTKRNMNSCKPRGFKSVDVFALYVADS
jgi:hypothetical protein